VGVRVWTQLAEDKRKFPGLSSLPTPSRLAIIQTMSAPDATRSGAVAQDGAFATTHWSVVLAAGHDSSPGAQEALEKLCRTYWYPLYGYVRRQGHSPEDAQDLTQAFFARLLEKNFVRRANRERGKFRSFLLTLLKHFLVDEWKRGQTARRGGAHVHLSWDQASAEERYQLEPASELTPENTFDQRWALTLFQKALAQLRDEYAAAGRSAQFDQLKNYLSDKAGDGGYASAAAALRMTTGAVSVAVHRLRERYGELVQGEVAHTVANPTEIQDELRYLIGLVSR
jgi:RNA polymerase sigma factor (sigma-70 family)